MTVDINFMVIHSVHRIVLALFLIHCPSFVLVVALKWARIS